MIKRLNLGGNPNIGVSIATNEKLAIIPSKPNTGNGEFNRRIIGS